MSEAKIVRVRNVNEALRVLKESRPEEDTVNWRRISPRGLETVEYKGMYVTEYTRPMERVLFSAARDANPFFHFFESLWILAGRKDVSFLSQFNSNIKNFSDDGEVFHAPYGYRLRRHFKKDQLLKIIDLLRFDPDTRQAVMMIWDPDEDLMAHSKDIPCNDMLALKLRDGLLDMTVMCRSNDAIWGAYGANAVQFSMIHEFIAGALGVGVGVYRQNSDSFHIYTNNDAWARVKIEEHQTDPYSTGFDMVPYSIFTGAYIEAGKGWRDHKTWLAELDLFFKYVDEPLDTVSLEYRSGFFADVVMPMYRAWRTYKSKKKDTAKEIRIDAATGILYRRCSAADWRTAGVEWLNRRRTSELPTT